MKHKIAVIPILMIILIIAMVGCSTEKKISDSTNSDNSYQKISSEAAKEMMDQDSSLIILDVRTAEEFNEGHIKGAVNISKTELESIVETAIQDKSSTILVYCLSGSRSALASQELSELGYLNVYDMGGISDWKYEVVTD